ncbi:MAG: hypothetical protein IKG27_04640 [Bacilli bacterium]|nr:hypothetical protein [Bacilli bacterium]
MKEAIANAGVFNLIIIFTIILMAFFIGSLGYSKAFKVKNYIINEIEKNEKWSRGVQEKVDNWLGEIGYRRDGARKSCPVINKKSAINDLQSSYHYCVYEFTNVRNEKGSASRITRSSKYYRVIAYMYFDVPVIGELVKIPVTGETKSFTTFNS